MTDKLKKVMAGYAELSDSEKQEFNEFVKNFDKLTYFEKGERSTKLKNESRVMGPTSSSACPCCGR